MSSRIREPLERWQRAISDELIDGVGAVVVEFFDVGRSRRWSWSDRQQAAALLAEAASPDRRFDAIVVGEYERAFHGDQFREIVTHLNDLGVRCGYLKREVLSSWTVRCTRH